MDLMAMMQQLRAALMDFAADAPDGKAAKYPALAKKWKSGVVYKVDDRRQYNGRLYKCQQAHTSQANWTPDITNALWVALDVEHEGSIEDPIPAVAGMEYIYGKYYYDSENGKSYLCSRVGAADGETIILQYLPHELVGQYFDEVSGDEN